MAVNIIRVVNTLVNVVGHETALSCLAGARLHPVLPEEWDHCAHGDWG